MNNHLELIDGFARDVIKKLRAQLEAGEVHIDLFSSFMDASNNNGNVLNNDEFRDIVLNSVNAVRDTTAQALIWTFYMLMCHPWMETKLLEEIEKFISHDDLTNSSFLYKKIKCMPYAHAIFYEVPRLYPSVPLNQKFTLNDDIWPVKTRIKKGLYLVVFLCSRSSRKSMRSRSYNI